MNIKSQNEFPVLNGLYSVTIDGVKTSSHRSARTAYRASRKYSASRRKVVIKLSGCDIDHLHFSAICRSEKNNNRDYSLSRQEKKSGFIIHPVYKKVS